MTFAHVSRQIRNNDLVGACGHGLGESNFYWHGSSSSSSGTSTGRRAVSKQLSSRSIATRVDTAFVGPVGGDDLVEIEQAAATQWKPTNLFKRLVHCQTKMWVFEKKYRGVEHVKKRRWWWKGRKRWLLCAQNRSWRSLKSVSLCLAQFTSAHHPGCRTDAEQVEVVVQAEEVVLAEPQPCRLWVCLLRIFKTFRGIQLNFIQCVPDSYYACCWPKGSPGIYLYLQI